MDKLFIKLVRCAVDDGIVQERATLCNEQQNKGTAPQMALPQVQVDLVVELLPEDFFYNYKVVQLLELVHCLLQPNV